MWDAGCVPKERCGDIYKHVHAANQNQSVINYIAGNVTFVRFYKPFLSAIVSLF